jgi:GDPmannose 4,6-dehydratase
LDTDNGKWLLKDDNTITSIKQLEYSDEVWDFETENHWFHAGIGGNIVHNTGPRRGDVFAESSFAKQIAMIEKGLILPVVKTGNLESLRTWSDVRDAVRAYYMLVTLNPIPGECYNIGGTYSCTVGEMLDFLISISTHKDHIKVQQDTERLRPLDADLQVPDTSKFKSHTGWEPEIPFEKTMNDLLDYWRDRVKSGSQFLTR